MGIRLRFILALALLGALSWIFGCACNGKDQERSDEMTQRSIEEVQKKNTPGWLSIEGVVGTGIGSSKGQRVIQVYVSELTAEIEAKIPTEVEGYRVVILESGEMRALEGE